MDNKNFFPLKDKRDNYLCLLRSKYGFNRVLKSINVSIDNDFDGLCKSLDG